MKKLINLWISRLRTYIIVRYMSGEISPIALLAIKNKLVLDHVLGPHSISEEICYPSLKIYRDRNENKYIATKLGFTLVEICNAQELLRSTQSELSKLFDKYYKLEEKSDEQSELLMKLRKKVAELIQLRLNISEELEILKSENLQLKKGKDELVNENAKLKNDVINLPSLKRENAQLKNLLTNNDYKKNKPFDPCENLGIKTKSGILRILDLSIPNIEILSLIRKVVSKK